jgi:hypothetical protein
MRFKAITPMGGNSGSLWDAWTRTPSDDTMRAERMAGGGPSHSGLRSGACIEAGMALWVAAPTCVAAAVAVSAPNALPANSMRLRLSAVGALVADAGDRSGIASFGESVITHSPVNVLTIWFSGYY